MYSDEQQEALSQTKGPKTCQKLDNSISNVRPSCTAVISESRYHRSLESIRLLFVVVAKLWHFSCLPGLFHPLQRKRENMKAQNALVSVHPPCSPSVAQLQIRIHVLNCVWITRYKLEFFFFLYKSENKVQFLAFLGHRILRCY